MARKTTQDTAALLDDLRALSAALLAQSDDYLRNMKAYHCRANAEIRAGLCKGAAVLRMDAAKIDAIVRKHSEAGNGDAEAKGQDVGRDTSKPATVAETHGQPEAFDGQSATDAEPADQDAGSLDVPRVPKSYFRA